MAEEPTVGFWEADVPKLKKLTTCALCSEDINRGEVRFRWRPVRGTPENCFFHAACGVRVGGESADHVPVHRRSLRKAMGLTRTQREELDVLLDAAEVDVATVNGPALGTWEKKNKKDASAGVGKPAKKAKLLEEAGGAPDEGEGGDGEEEAAGMAGEVAKKESKAKNNKGKAAAQGKAKAGVKGKQGAGADNEFVQKTIEKGKSPNPKAVKGKAKALLQKPAAKPSAAAAAAAAVQGGGKAKCGRVADVAAEPLEMLGPIMGVMDVPRKPLVQAAVATGVPHMDACAFLALENGTHVAANDPYGLNADEAGVLNLYTMESDLYARLNARLRDRDRQALRPFFPLLKLLLLARAKLPKFAGTVWRGVKADLRAAYPKGKELYWWAFSSTTKELSTLTKPVFLGTKGVRTIFNIQVVSGVDIMRYSVYQGPKSEAEVLLFPGTKLRVVDAMDMGHGLYQVHLREVAMPVKLLQ